MIIIRLSDTVVHTFSSDEGLKMYRAVEPYLHNDSLVTIDLAGSHVVTSSFLNPFVGDLIDILGVEGLKAKFRFANVSTSNADILRRYIKHFEKSE